MADIFDTVMKIGVTDEIAHVLRDGRRSDRDPFVYNTYHMLWCVGAEV